MNNYPKVVEQIHHEFNTAGDLLLKSSLDIIAKEKKKDLRKGELLNSFGFKNALQSGEFQKSIETINTALSTSKNVINLSNEFFGYKFISTDDVNKICKKYNLIKGSIEQYKGFVPEKNLNDIGIFKNGRKLKTKLRVTKIKVSGLFSGRLNAFLNPKCRIVMSFIKRNDYTFIVNNENEIKSILKQEAKKIKKDVWFEINELNTIPVSIFEICAPSKDMIKKSVYDKLFPKFEFEIVPDPVVLYPVNNGYIIVTAWGNEASDPLVVNEQMN